MRVFYATLVGLVVGAVISSELQNIIQDWVKNQF